MCSYYPSTNLESNLSSHKPIHYSYLKRAVCIHKIYKVSDYNNSEYMKTKYNLMAPVCKMWGQRWNFKYFR